MGNESTYSICQRALVASLLYDGEHTNRVLELTSSADFSEPSLRLVMEAVTSVARRSQKVSAVSVAEELEACGQLAAAGGTHTIYQLSTEGQDALQQATAETYATIVREGSAKAAVVSCLRDAAPGFRPDSGVSARDGIAALQQSLSHEMLRLADDASTVAVADYVDGYMDVLEDRERIRLENSAEAEGLQGIPSMVPSLNRYTSGFTPEQLITVGAKTGVGKSVFAVMQAIACGQAGKSVMFFSLEMSHAEIVDRIMANLSGVSLNKLKNGWLSAEDREQVRQAQKELGRMKIVIDTDAHATIDSLRSKAVRQAQSEDGLDMLILDYLQLLNTREGDRRNRQEIVADLSRNMKVLAKTLGIPVMILTQLNRGKSGDDEDNPLPTLDNIRESGAIANDSDIVILLHRDTAADNTTPQTLVILEKNRNGVAHKVIRCHSNLEHSMLHEVTRSQETAEMDEDEMQEVAAAMGIDLDPDMAGALGSEPL